jgi:D-alanine-D-alanine ligase
VTGHDLRAVVVAGGLSYERDVSLKSGRRVADALRRHGVDTTLLDVDPDLVGQLRDTEPHAVFLALHGPTGEDGSLRAVLDLIGTPYVGTAPDACRVAWDKPTAKAVIRAAGVGTPDWIVLPQSTFRELGADAVLPQLVARFGLPLMVKPAQGGSALGAEVVETADDLPSSLVSSFAYGDAVLVEPYIVGTEVAVTVLEDENGPVALPAIEISPTSGVFDYASRYTPGTTTYHAPARLPDDVSTALADAAVAAHRALHLRDISRFDAIVTAAGEIQFLEVSVAPGMTETSLAPMAIAAADRDLGAACVALLRSASRRQGTSTGAF